MRRGVLKALSSSESAALLDSRFALYIRIWRRSPELSFSGKRSRNLSRVMARSASLHCTRQSREISRYLSTASRNA